MKELLADIKGTFTSLDYYKDVLKFSFGRSLKLFLFYFTILAFITTAVIAVTIYVPLNVSIAKLPTIAKNLYPKELEVRVNKGQVTTNVKEPYMISLSKVEQYFKNSDIDTTSQDQSSLKNLVVIDTHANIDDFHRYQTVALITKNHISYIKDQGNIETVPLTNIDNLTINQTVVNNFVTKIAPILKIVIPFLIVLTFFGILIFYSLFKMIYLLWIGLVVMIVSKLLSRPIEYGKAYQVSLHFALVVTTFVSLLTILKINLNVPFLTTLLYILVAFIVLNRMKEAKAIASSKKK